MCIVSVIALPCFKNYLADCPCFNMVGGPRASYGVPSVCKSCTTGGSLAGHWSFEGASFCVQVLSSCLAM